MPPNVVRTMSFIANLAFSVVFGVFLSVVIAAFCNMQPPRLPDGTDTRNTQRLSITVSRSGQMVINGHPAAGYRANDPVDIIQYDGRLVLNTLEQRLRNGVWVPK